MKNVSMRFKGSREKFKSWHRRLRREWPGECDKRAKATANATQEEGSDPPG